MVDRSSATPASFATFTSAEFHDPAATEVSLEMLQIVRETLNNIQKHSGATRVAVSAARIDQQSEDHGGGQRRGIPVQRQIHAGELELLRLGPVSIKRRVRMLGGRTGDRVQAGTGRQGRDPDAGVTAGTMWRAG